jgi:bifunctional DNase/RNase
MEIPVELSKIIINEEVDQQIIVLKELDGTRSFPIVIGINEILAIDRRLKGISLPRPMTHDLLEGVIQSLGGQIQKLVITDIEKHTFYAFLHIQVNGDIVKIDSRPSDALALVSGLDVPVFVDENVFLKLQQ